VLEKMGSSSMFVLEKQSVHQCLFRKTGSSPMFALEFINIFILEKQAVHQCRYENWAVELTHLRFFNIVSSTAVYIYMACD
jgi:hypothetical protein